MMGWQIQLGRAQQIQYGTRRFLSPPNLSCDGHLECVRAAQLTCAGLAGLSGLMGLRGLSGLQGLSCLLCLPTSDFGSLGRP